MMTSSNGNIFRVTGPLCGEFTGHQWIPLTKASDAGLWCFLWSAPEQNGWVNNWDADDLRHHRADYDVTLMFTALGLSKGCDIMNYYWFVQFINHTHHISGRSPGWYHQACSCSRRVSLASPWGSIDRRRFPCAGTRPGARDVRDDSHFRSLSS